MKEDGAKGIDLNVALPDSVIKNQAPPTGESVFLEIDGVVHNYHHDDDLFIGDRMSKRLRAEQGWFEKLVKHAPSVGSFYEDALRSIVNEILPSQYKVGTGFVFDTLRRKSEKQLDIIVYDDRCHAPLYRNGDFVVVRPDMSVSVSEVKKVLTVSGLRNIIRTTINSRVNVGSGIGQMNVFVYETKLSMSRIFSVVREEIINFTSSLKMKTKSGHDAVMGLENIVLPNIYLLNKCEYIESRVVCRNDNKCDIFLSQYPSYVDGGLGNYLSRMAGSKSSGGEFDERNFMSMPIRNINIEEKIVDGLFLFYRVPLLKLMSLFSMDTDEIRSFRVSQRRPYEALVPIGVDILQVKNFREFRDLNFVSWSCF